MNNSYYKLGIIELFFPNRHLEDFNIYEHELNGYFICTLEINLTNFYNKKLMYLLKKSYKIFYEKNFIDYEKNNHYYHKNFKNIVDDDNYFNVKIIKIINTNNLKIIIDKTHYLRIIQKKWKKYCYMKKKYLYYALGSELEDDSSFDSS